MIKIFRDLCKGPLQLQKAENMAYVRRRGKKKTSATDIKTAQSHERDQERSLTDGITTNILVEVPGSPSYLPLTEFSSFVHKNRDKIDIRKAYIAVKDGQKYHIQATNKSKNEMIDIKIYLDGLFAGHLPVPRGQTRTFKHTRLEKDKVHKISFTKIDYSENDENARLNKWFNEPGTISLKVYDAERLNLTEYELRKQAAKELKHGFTSGVQRPAKKMRFGMVKCNTNAGDEEDLIPTHLSTIDASVPLPIQDKEYYVWSNNPILYANYIYRSKEILKWHHKIPSRVRDRDLVQRRGPKIPNKKFEPSREDSKVDTKETDSGHDKAMHEEDNHMPNLPSPDDKPKKTRRRRRRRKPKDQGQENQNTDPNAEKSQTQKSQKENAKPVPEGQKGYKKPKKIDTYRAS